MKEKEELNKLLLSVEIPNYITEIKLSNSRRAQFFKTTTKLPKKYQDKTKYNYKYFGTNRILFDLATNKPVVKNIKTAGKARMMKIRGNDLYSGYQNFMIRNNLFRIIKEYFSSHFLNINPITDYPVHIEFLVYDKLVVQKNNLKSKQQDLDNLLVVYIKNIIDVLVLNGIILDDNLSFVQCISKEFIPTRIGDRKMVINIYKHERI